MPSLKSNRLNKNQTLKDNQCSKLMMDEENMSTVVNISCDLLEEYLQTKSNLMLVIDCRSFLAHTETHITDAINIHCPPILRRRTGGRLSLKTIITDREIRERLIAGQFCPVILYDDSNNDSNYSPIDSMTAFVARSLQQETSLKCIYILEGGFQQFQRQYPNSCTSLSNYFGPNFNKNPSSACLNWFRKGNYKGCSSPRTPKNINFGFDSSHALISFGSDKGEPVEILPYLYLGSGYHSSCKYLLDKFEITALLNVSHTCPNHFEDYFTYKCIPVEDSGSEDISVWFDEAIDFIDSIKQSNGKVLVHCRAGISRSATICMAYLMATKKLKMEEAYEYVKTRRRIISPNFNFMGQLLNFETKIFSTNGWNGISKKACHDSPRSPLIAFSANNNLSTAQFSSLSSPEEVGNLPISRLSGSNSQRTIFEFNHLTRECRTSDISHSLYDQINVNQYDHMKTCKTPKLMSPT